MIKWRKKSKTIQTLLTFNRKNRRNRGKFYTHLHDWSLSWIGQVTSIEIDDVKLVLCSQASLVSEMMRHVCVSYVSKMIPLTCYLSISIVGGTYLYIVSTRAMVLNAIFNKLQLYRCGHFYCWGKAQYPEKTTDFSQVTDILYHIMFIECTSPDGDSDSKRYLW